MKYLIVSTAALLTLSACQTKVVEVPVDRPVPIYLTIHPERPTVALEELEWLYLPEEELLALTPDEFDKNNNNWAAVESYIKQLQQGILYYEKATTQPD